MTKATHTRYPANNPILQLRRREEALDRFSRIRGNLGQLGRAPGGGRLLLNTQAQVVAGGIGEVLLDAEVAFGGLNGGMS